MERITSKLPINVLVPVSWLIFRLRMVRKAKLPRLGGIVPMKGSGERQLYINKVRVSKIKIGKNRCSNLYQRLKGYKENEKGRNKFLVVLKVRTIKKESQLKVIALIRKTNPYL